MQGPSSSSQGPGSVENPAGGRGGRRNTSGGRPGREGGIPSSSWSDVAKKGGDGEQPGAGAHDGEPSIMMSFGTIGMDEPIHQAPPPVAPKQLHGGAPPPPQHHHQQRSSAPGLKPGGPPQHGPAPPALPPGMVPQRAGMPAAPPGLVPPHLGGGPPTMMMPAAVMGALPALPPGMVPPMAAIPPPPGILPPPAGGKGPMQGMPMPGMQGKPGHGSAGAPPPPPPRTGPSHQQQGPPQGPPPPTHMGGGKPYAQQGGGSSQHQAMGMPHAHASDSQQQGRRGGASQRSSYSQGGTPKMAGGHQGGGYQQAPQPPMQQPQAPPGVAGVPQPQQFVAAQFGYGFYNGGPPAAFAYPVQMYPAAMYAPYAAQQAAPFMPVPAQGYPPQAMPGTPTAVPTSGAVPMQAPPPGGPAPSTPAAPSAARAPREPPKAPPPSAAPAAPATIQAPKSKRIAIVNPNTKEEVKVETATAAGSKPAADKQPAAAPAAAPAPAPASAPRPKPPAIVPPTPPATAAAATATGGASTPSKEIMAMAQQQAAQQQAAAQRGVQPPVAPGAPGDTAAAAGKGDSEVAATPAERAPEPAVEQAAARAAAPAAAEEGAEGGADSSEEGTRSTVRNLVQSYTEAIAKSAGPPSPKAAGKGDGAETSTQEPAAAQPAPPAAKAADAAAVADGQQHHEAGQQEAKQLDAAQPPPPPPPLKQPQQPVQPVEEQQLAGSAAPALADIPPPPARPKAEEVAAAAPAPSRVEPDSAAAAADDWEDQAETAAAPKAPASVGPAVSPFAGVSTDDGRRKYSRDYFTKLRELPACQVKPSLMTEIEEIVNDPSAPGYTPAAGGFDRALSRGDSRGVRRSGPPERVDSDWGMRGPRVGMPGPGGPGSFRDGPRSGGGAAGPGMLRADSGRRGGPPPTGVDADRWARGGPLPPARGMAVPPRRELPALHKSESAFRVGLVLSDDPEEEAKQKAFKGVLNKLTPDNFDRLTQQLLDVGITEAKTLVGLISQIFDKALFEPHFCELYSMLCQTLQKRLPEFDDPTEEPVEAGGEVKRRKLNFRRLLLNKCQEEFEKGDAAMNAVAEREAKAKERGSKDDADGDDEEQQQQQQQEQADAPAEGGGDGGKDVPDQEEGETSPPKPTKPLDAKAAALEARRAERAAAEEELKARRRMLGNIQFIGHLYRFSMLTENIMHSCIQRLLQDDQNPKLEDLECLCKLLSTIGQQLERPQFKGTAGMTQAQLAARQKEENAKAKKMMDAYFARIQRLVENKALDSRLRFMLMDIMEQRQRGWAVRRKAEGPMKIEEVHRAAKREADVAARADRGGRGPPPGRGPPGGYGGDLPRRGSGVDHLRRDELPTAPMKAQLGARTASTEISLRPQGFGLKGASPMRGAGERRAATGAGSSRMGGAPEQPPPPAQPGQPQAPGRPPPPQQQQQQQQRDDDGSAAGSGRPSDAGLALSEAEVAGSLASVVKLLFGQADDTGDTPEQLLQNVVGGADDVGGALQSLLRQCLDVRGVPLEERLERPKAFLASQLEEGGCLDNTHLEAAFLGPSGFVAHLSDLVEDIPKAPVLTGRMLGDFVASGRLALRPIADAMLEDKPRGSGGGDEGGDEEEEGQDPPLVDAEQALPLVVALLSRWREVAGDDGGAARAAWQSSGLEWRQLLPSFAREDADVGKALERHGGSWLASS